MLQIAGSNTRTEGKNRTAANSHLPLMNVGDKILSLKKSVYIPRV